MSVSIQKTKRGRAVASVSMAPMIDMVFLLLVFFMAASTLSQAGSKLEVDLPVSSEAVVSEDFSGRLILSLDAAGTAFLGVAALSEADLAETLATFRTECPGGKLSIRAAKDTPFSAVKRVMKLAAEAGVSNYLYASYQSESRG